MSDSENTPRENPEESSTADSSLPPNGGDINDQSVSGMVEEQAISTEATSNETNTASNEDLPVAPDPVLPGPQDIRRAVTNPRDRAKKKNDRDLGPKPQDVTVEGVRKARAVFVPPVHYLQQVDNFSSDRRIWVVTGPPQSGKFTCALHLGLSLLRQGRPLDRDLYRAAANQDGQGRREDYARGIQRLRQRLESRRSLNESVLEEDALVELAALESRLLDNLSRMDNENRRSDRYEALAELNNRSLKLFSMTFSDLCRWTDIQNGISDDTVLLQSLPSVKVIRRDGRDTLRLPNILHEQNTEQQTIYVVERAFESGVGQSELNPSLEANLNSSNSYLILTTELTEKALGQIAAPRISTRFPSNSSSEQRLFLLAVLQAHLDYYGAIDGLPEALNEKVEKASEHIVQHALQQPFTIDMFCARLRGIAADATSDVVLTLADQVGRINREATRTWFAGLPKNERLYALLAYLFDGTDRHLLDNLYMESVRFLRQDGVAGLRDPREQGLDAIRDRIRAHVTESNTIQFNNPALKEEVHRQVTNYHHILWSLCEHVFVPLINRFRDNVYDSFRQDLGTAIGRLGMYYEVSLEPLLEELAANESGGIASTAGYILDGLVRANPALCSWAAERIMQWASSADPNRMWASAIAVWRIYESVTEITRGDYASTYGRQAHEALNRLRESLTKIATHPDQFDDTMQARAITRAEVVARDRIPDPSTEDAQAQVRVQEARHQLQQELVAAQLQDWFFEVIGGVLLALQQLSHQHINDVVDLVTAWLLESPSTNQHAMGEVAAQQLISSTVEQQRPVRLVAERHAPLLKLISPMLDAEEELLRGILQVLRRWTDQSSWDARVHQALLQVITEASFVDRARLARLIIEEWYGENSTVSSIAQNLVARARLIDGRPVDVYGSEAIVILCDSALPSKRQRDIANRLTQLIASDLAVIGTVRTGALGFTLSSTTPTPDPPSKPNSALAPTLAPRLIAPVLEALTSPNSPLALVITWGPILDLEDIVDNFLWKDKLLLGVLGAYSDIPKDVQQVEIPTRASVREAADRLIAIASLHLFQRLAARDATMWWHHVSPLLQETIDLNAIDDRLVEWAATLDQLPSNVQTDPLRFIVTTISWMANADIEGCVERLKRWLGDTNQHLQQAGGAAARALFYLFGSATPTPPVDRYGILLHLIKPFTSQGWASTEAVLFAVRRWARSPAWVERLLSPNDGSPSELLELVVELDVTDQQRLAQQLKTWDAVLNGDDPENTHRYVTQVREQISLRVALGSGRTLSALISSGQAYGILVVDTSIARRQLRGTIAQVASAAIRALRKQYGSSLQLLVFRLGQVTPLAGPTEKPAADIIAPPSGGLPPRLLGPLLERLPIEQVRFVVLLSPAQTYDEDDWYETPWASRIHVYSGSNRTIQSFGAIPSQRTPSDGGKAIVEYLNLRYPHS